MAAVCALHSIPNRRRAPSRGLLQRRLSSFHGLFDGAASARIHALALLSSASTRPHEQNVNRYLFNSHAPGAGRFGARLEALGRTVSFQSVGGLKATKRVQGGAKFDIVVLAEAPRDESNHSEYQHRLGAFSRRDGHVGRPAPTGDRHRGGAPCGRHVGKLGRLLDRAERRRCNDSSNLVRSVPLQDPAPFKRRPAFRSQR